MSIRTRTDLDLELEIGKVADMAAVVGIVLDSYETEVQGSRTYDVPAKMVAKSHSRL